MCIVSLSIVKQLSTLISTFATDICTYVIGLQVVESTAFVSPKWVPQMADHMDIYRGLRNIITNGRSVAFPALCPNVKGFQSCLEAGVREIAVFGAASGMERERATNELRWPGLLELAALYWHAEPGQRS